MNQILERTQSLSTVTLTGTGLSVEAARSVALGLSSVEISDDPQVLQRVEKAHALMQEAAQNGEIIYGVTTGFGGMANILISTEQINEVSHNMLWIHKAGLGKSLPREDVRAAMLLRANSHLRGASGIRLELIKRLQIFLNEKVTPCIPELGSIGASGDLVPLSYLAGALIGHEAGYMVHYLGIEMPATEALAKLGLPRLELQPKEALAMLNGTSVMTGIALNCIQETRAMFAIAMNVHAMLIQALNGTNLSFHPFIHEQKPHPGQKWTAAVMKDLLAGSTLVRDGKDGTNRNPESGLVQDRYSLRCLPQYLGPIAEGIEAIAGQLETEMNSANDNPLIDVDTGGIFYGGNFLGEYVGIGMDRTRYYIGLIAKHLDVQIAQVITPEFSNGLAPSLVGNQERNVNMGLKALQIVGNSIMPLLSFYGNSLADRFPTHAEQCNQNINSQGFGSANLTRQSLDLFRQYLALSMIVAVQALDLRSYKMTGSYDAHESLSEKTRPIYSAVRSITQRPAEAGRPWLWDDGEHSFDLQIGAIADQLTRHGPLWQACCANIPTGVASL